MSAGGPLIKKAHCATHLSAFFEVSFEQSIKNQSLNVNRDNLSPPSHSQQARLTGTPLQGTNPTTFANGPTPSTLDANSQDRPRLPLSNLTGKADASSGDAPRSTPDLATNSRGCWQQIEPLTEIGLQHTGVVCPIKSFPWIPFRRKRYDKPPTQLQAHP